MKLKHSDQRRNKYAVRRNNHHKSNNNGYYATLQYLIIRYTALFCQDYYPASRKESCGSRIPDETEEYSDQRRNNYAVRREISKKVNNG